MYKTDKKYSLIFLKHTRLKRFMFIHTQGTPEELYRKYYLKDYSVVEIQPIRNTQTYLFLLLGTSIYSKFIKFPKQATKYAFDFYTNVLHVPLTQSLREYLP